MPTPSSSLATLRPELGTFMEFDLAASRAGFIGRQVLPVLEVRKQSGAFGTLKLEDLLQRRDTKRAPGAGYARQTHEFDDLSYATVEHGAEEPVDDREAEMYSDYFQAEVVSAARALDVVVREYEIRVAAAVQAAGSGTAVGTPWSTAATATPVTDVEGRITALRDGRGVRANAVILGWTAYRECRQTTQVKDLIAASGAGEKILPENITPSMLARVWDVETVLVGDAQYNNSGEGATITSLANVWDPSIVCVTKIARTQDIREICLGRTFHWGEDGSVFGAMVESYREEQTRSDIIRSRMDTDEKIIYSSACERLTGVT